MSKRFLTSIDLSKNEVQNVVIHKVATFPTNPKSGQIVFHTGENREFMRIDGQWKDITGRLDEILSNTNALVVTDNGDNTLTLEIKKATTNDAGLLSAELYQELINATKTPEPDTFVKRDADGSTEFKNVTVTEMGNTPDSLTTKGYVDNLVAYGVNLLGNIDASTNPNFPDASNGDSYHITKAGYMGGEGGLYVEVGDLIVAVVESEAGTEADVGQNWIVMQRNLDMATSSKAGFIKIATPEDVENADENSAVTPKRMISYVSTLVAGNKYATNIGDGVATTIEISHGIGSTDVQVQLQDNTTKEYVEAGVFATTENSVTISFATAPSTNAYRVVIQG